MHALNPSSASLGAKITRAASQQTYYTIRFFVDRARVADAYRAYGYFRWVDDILDSQQGLSLAGKQAFLARQQAILAAHARGESLPDLCPEEGMLADLLASDPTENSGLRMYLENMMAVMAFDVARRGRPITQSELTGYTANLAIAITEALFYFIGNDGTSRPLANAMDDQMPFGLPERYQAVAAAHVTHLLRDAVEDNAYGYYNVPQEVLQRNRLAPQDIASPAYRAWICQRVQAARAAFKVGRSYIARVKSLRCRLAGFAYTARFEWMLRKIEKDHYCLRAAYPERKGWRTAAWMGWHTITSLFGSLLRNLPVRHSKTPYIELK